MRTRILRIELLVGNSTRDKWKVVTADYENTYYLDKELNRPFGGRRTQGGHIALWTKEPEEEFDFAVINVDI